ncbi:putative bifunctional diguanylate cyclase/phosphodiesterase [Methylobacterium sp. J-090]|uniref:putative bifunctional diguanylate cyclase/phosphodiesterase n=1 Tax=Methylobacterium sp. J-090 TaxID=2836666 RepID=UPI001FBA906B|nr:EAL domain-containing protein [Methylobacterium sp. J-090]MCJ2080539.1 EAL domain-containing protein [Methylobacterium sp. J-090]
MPAADTGSLELRHEAFDSAGSGEGAEQTAPSDRYRIALATGQLAETLHLAPYTALTHVVAATTVLLLFWGHAPAAYLLALFAGAVLPATACIAGVWFCRRACLSATRVETAHAAVRILALTLGLAWATMPAALFVRADADHGTYVVALCAGLLTTAYALGPIRHVATLFALPVVMSGFLALVARGDDVSRVLAILFVIYASFVLFTTGRMARLSTGRIVARLRVAEQNETIGLLLNDFTENASAWLWETGPDGRLQNVSQRLVQISGKSPTQLRDAPFESLLRGTKLSGAEILDAGSSQAVSELVALVGRRQAFRERVVEVTIAGAAQWWRLSGKPLHGPSGDFLGFRGVGTDITAARQSEARIAYLASYDALTGLANRALFQDLASMECERAERTGMPCALLYLDLDGFKIVNDTFGHALGDALLIQVATRLSALVRPGDLVARLGGDEFAILHPCADADDASALARAVIGQISVPYIIDGVQVEIGVSIGFALAPNDATTPETLLGRADLALYRAKAAGRGEVSEFTPDLEASVLKRRDLEVDLKRAIVQDELSLHYQPLVGLAAGEVRGFEALLRWNRRSGGSVSPADFIPVAEASGLIAVIGRWVLHQACREAARWPEPIRIAVNISPTQFRHADFVLDVFQALEASGLAPERLELEITESVFFEMNGTTVSNLKELQGLGVRIALDDFGTGYSSLSYLIRFPVDKIKIDRSFINEMGTRHECLAIIEAILTLARELSITVTAEGVETVEQAAMLRTRGCDDIQGFLFSPGRPSAEVDGLIATLPSRFASIFSEAPEARAAA